MDEHGTFVAKEYIARLQPLTPIHVWSGQKLVVGFDLVRLRDGRICLADVDKMPKDIAEKLVRADVKAIPRILEESSDRLVCKQIIQSDVDLTTITTSAKESIMVQELNQYIVPGSTLKGYIRTALLYYLLSRSIKTDPKKAEDIVKGGLNLDPDGKPRDVSIGLEASFFRAPRPQFKKKRKGKEFVLEPIGGGFVDSFQSLLVSDPDMRVNSGCYRLIEISSYELPSQGSGDLNLIGSQYAIVVTCGELVYNLKVVKPLDVEDVVKRIDKAVKMREVSHEKAVEKLAVLSKENILDALWEFGCQILSLEISRVRNVNKLKAYHELLLKYRKRYCEKRDKCVIARIGFGGGVYSKTVLSLIKNYYPDIYNHIVNYMSTKIGHTWDEKTIKLTYLAGSLIGLGWCELCLEE